MFSKVSGRTSAPPHRGSLAPSRNKLQEKKKKKKTEGTLQGPKRRLGTPRVWPSRGPRGLDVGNDGRLQRRVKVRSPSPRGRSKETEKREPRQKRGHGPNFRPRQSEPGGRGRGGTPDEAFAARIREGASRMDQNETNSRGKQLTKEGRACLADGETWSIASAAREK